MIRRLAVCLAALAAWPAAASAATTQDDVYALVHGCYQLQPGGDAFRFQATELGQYLLYDTDRRFLAATDDGGTERAAEPSPAADWKVTPSGDGFRFEADWPVQPARPELDGIAARIRRASRRLEGGDR